MEDDGYHGGGNRSQVHDRLIKTRNDDTQLRYGWEFCDGTGIIPRRICSFDTQLRQTIEISQAWSLGIRRFERDTQVENIVTVYAFRMASRFFNCRCVAILCFNVRAQHSDVM